jgi:hypothetical protein
LIRPGAKQAAEKDRISNHTSKSIPQGLKPVPFTEARLKEERQSMRGVNGSNQRRPASDD